MARPPRVDVGGYAYHVLNRTAGRWRMFNKDGDFEAFERVLEEGGRNGVRPRFDGVNESE